MNKEALNLIENYYNDNSDKIFGIYPSGSSCLPFINRCGDNDFLILAKTEDYIADLNKEIFKLSGIDGLKLFPYNTDTGQIKIDMMVRKTDFFDFNANKYYPIWLYQFHFMNEAGQLHGNKYKFVEMLECDELKIKDSIYRYKLMMDYNWATLPDGTSPKYYYQIIASTIFLYNKSYTLTDEEKEIINLAHERHLSKEKRKWFEDKYNDWLQAI